MLTGRWKECTRLTFSALFGDINAITDLAAKLNEDDTHSKALYFILIHLHRCSIPCILSLHLNLFVVHKNICSTQKVYTDKYAQSHFHASATGSALWPAVTLLTSLSPTIIVSIIIIMYCWTLNGLVVQCQRISLYLCNSGGWLVSVGFQKFCSHTHNFFRNS